MTSREIVIDKDVTLDGEGNLTVDGNRRHRVFSVPGGVTAELIGLTVANGRQADEQRGRHSERGDADADEQHRLRELRRP